MSILNFLTPYNRNRHEITDKHISDWHDAILREFSKKSLVAIRDEIGKKLTFHLTGDMYNRLVELYEFANYRIGLIIKNEK